MIYKTGSAVAVSVARTVDVTVASVVVTATVVGTSTVWVVTVPSRVTVVNVLRMVSMLAVLMIVSVETVPEMVTVLGTPTTACTYIFTAARASGVIGWDASCFGHLHCFLAALFRFGGYGYLNGNDRNA